MIGIFLDSPPRGRAVADQKRDFMFVGRDDPRVRIRAARQVACQVFQYVLGATTFPWWRLDVTDPIDRLKSFDQRPPGMVGLQVPEIAFEFQLAPFPQSSEARQKVIAKATPYFIRIDKVGSRRRETSDATAIRLSSTFKLTRLPRASVHFKTRDRQLGFSVLLCHDCA